MKNKFINILVSLLVFFFQSCISFQPDYKELKMTIEKNQFDKTLDISEIYFLNDTIGFGISKDLFYKTDDDGKNWTVCKLNNNLSVITIYFIDNKCGFISCDTDQKQGIFLKTVDCGNTWTEINANIPVKKSDEYLYGDIDYISIFALNVDTLFFIGSYGSTDTSWFVKSFDGGNTWNYEKTISLRQISFIDKKVGFANGWGGIIKTDDGGYNWKMVSKGPCLDLIMLNKKEGFQVAPEGIYKTEDGGIKWNKNRKNWTGDHSFHLMGDPVPITEFEKVNDNELVFIYLDYLIKFTKDCKNYYIFKLPYWLGNLQVYKKNRAKILVGNSVWDIRFLPSLCMN